MADPLDSQNRGAHVSELSNSDREIWEGVYRVLTGTLELMMRSAPTAEEARRRIDLVRLDLAVCEGALDKEPDYGPARKLIDAALPSDPVPPPCPRCGFNMKASGWVHCPQCGKELPDAAAIRARFTGKEGT